MEQVIVLVLLTLLSVAAWKYRSDAAKERKLVVARIAAEKEERGDYSPLAEVFREAGIDASRLADETVLTRPQTAAQTAPTPIPPSASASSPAPAPAPAPAPQPNPSATAAPQFQGVRTIEPSRDLRPLFADGLPTGLSLFGPLEATRVYLLADAPTSVVRAAIEQHFDKEGLRHYWSVPTEVQVEFMGAVIRGTLHPDAATARDDSGVLLFPGLAPGSCVAHFSVG